MFNLDEPYGDFRIATKQENIFESLLNQIVEEAKTLGIDQSLGRTDETAPKLEELKQQLYDHIMVLMKI